MRRDRDVDTDLDRVKQVLRNQARLTAWEMDFIDNVHDRLTDGKSMTPRQGHQLDKIWERVVLRPRQERA